MKRQDLAELGQLRSLLSARARSVKRAAARLHDLALRLGIWSNGSYSPSLKRGRSNRKMSKALGMAWLDKTALGVVKHEQPIFFFDRLSRHGRRVSNKPPLVDWAWVSQDSGHWTKVMPHSFQTTGSNRSAFFSPSRLSDKLSQARFYAPVSGPALNFSIRETSKAASQNSFSTHASLNEQNVPLTPRGDSWLDRETGNKSADRKTGSTLGRLESSYVISDRNIPRAGQASIIGHEFSDALDDYFFRQSRLPPIRGTAFDPRLTPLWAGMKIPL